MAGEGILDLTGKGLSFMVSFDNSRARESLNGLESPLNSVIDLFNTMSDKAQSAVSDINDVIGSLSASFKSLANDISSIDASSASRKLEEFGHRAEETLTRPINELKQILDYIKELSGKLTEIGSHESLRGINDSTRALNNLRNAAKDASGQQLEFDFGSGSRGAGGGGVPPGGDGGDGGVTNFFGGGRLTRIAAATTALLGLQAASEGVIDKLNETGLTIERAGAKIGLTEDAVKNWITSLQVMRDETGASLSSYKSLAAEFITSYPKLREFGKAHWLLEFAGNSETYLGMSSRAVGTLLAEFNRVGIVGPENIGKISDDIAALSRGGRSDIDELLGNLGRMSEQFERTYNTIISLRVAEGESHHEAARVAQEALTGMMGRTNAFVDAAKAANISTEQSLQMLSVFYDTVNNRSSETSLKLNAFLSQLSTTNAEAAAEITAAWNNNDPTQLIASFLRTAEQMPAEFQTIGRDLITGLTGMDFNTVIKAGMGEALTEFEINQRKLASSTGEFSNTIARASNDTNVSLTKMGNALDAFIDKAAQSDPVRGLVGFFTDLVTSVTSAVGPTTAGWATIGAAATSFLGSMAVFKSMLGVEGSVIGGMKRLGGSVAGLVSGGFGKLDGLVGGLTSKLGGLSTVIKSFIKAGAWDLGLTVVRNSVEYLRSAVPEVNTLITGLSGTFKSTENSLYDFSNTVRERLEQISPTIASGWETLSSVIRTSWNSLKDDISTIWEEGFLLGGMKTVVKYLQSTWDFFADTIKSGVSLVSGKINDLAGYSTTVAAAAIPSAGQVPQQSPVQYVASAGADSGGNSTTVQYIQSSDSNAQLIAAVNRQTEVAAAAANRTQRVAIVSGSVDISSESLEPIVSATARSGEAVVNAVSRAGGGGQVIDTSQPPKIPFEIPVTK